MFVVVRSVFWLTVAYMVIKPGVDLPDAGRMSQAAMAAGSQVIAEQIQAVECDSLQCFGSKAVVAAALQTTPSIDHPMHEISITPFVPLPRARPDRTG